MTEQENRTIREALSSCLSGVDALPSMRSDILRAVKGEKKVKRKLSKGLVLALVLILMMSSVAVAAGLGMSLEVIAEANVEKLQKRYPKGFEADRSVNREKYAGEL